MRLAILESNVHAKSAENNVEIHSINTKGRIILDTQINVFLDTKTKGTVYLMKSYHDATHIP